MRKWLQQQQLLGLFTFLSTLFVPPSPASPQCESTFKKIAGFIDFANRKTFPQDFDGWESPFLKNEVLTDPQRAREVVRAATDPDHPSGEYFRIKSYVESGNGGIWEKYLPIYPLIVGSTRGFQLTIARIHEILGESVKIVADLGTGPGVIAGTLAHLNPQRRFIGVDGNEAALNNAGKILRLAYPSQTKRFELVHANLDTQDVPHIFRSPTVRKLAPAGKVDAIIVHNVLYALQNKQQFLTGAKAILKNGGILILADPKPVLHDAIKLIEFLFSVVIGGLHFDKAKMQALRPDYTEFPPALAAFANREYYTDPTVTTQFKERNELIRELRTAGFKVDMVEDAYYRITTFTVSHPHE